MSTALALDPITAAQQAVDAIDDAAEEYAAATHEEMEYEALRPEVKAMAIRRIMERDGIAATPAEKLVHEDREYAMHLFAQRDAAAATIATRGRYESAKRRADLAILLAGSPR